MDKKDNIVSLTDDELDYVAGGTGTNDRDRTDYCDACVGGGKKALRKEGGRAQLVCQNCGKIYETCPVCGASWGMTVQLSLTEYSFNCDGYSCHTFTAYGGE